MKVGGQILWNVTPICETSLIYYLMGRPFVKDVLGNHLRSDYSIWFNCWVSPYNFEGSVKNPSIWKESPTWIVPWIRSVRGENLEGWRTDRRPWGVGDDERIGNLLEKTQVRKRWYFSNKENLFFQSQKDESKPLEEIRNWEHPPWYGIDQFKERVILTFLENQKGLFQNLKIHFRMRVKR